MAKLTKDKMIRVKRLLDEGVPVRDIAEIMGVEPTTIYSRTQDYRKRIGYWQSSSDKEDILKSNLYSLIVRYIRGEINRKFIYDFVKRHDLDYDVEAIIKSKLVAEFNKELQDVILNFLLASKQEIISENTALRKRVKQLSEENEELEKVCKKERGESFLERLKKI